MHRSREAEEAGGGGGGYFLPAGSDIAERQASMIPCRPLSAPSESRPARCVASATCTSISSSKARA